VQDSGFSGFFFHDNWPMLALLARVDCELVTDRVLYAIRQSGEVSLDEDDQARPDSGADRLPG